LLLTEVINIGKITEYN